MGCKVTPDTGWLWGRGRRYCVEGAAGGGKKPISTQTSFFGSNTYRRTDIKCLVVGLGSRLGFVDGTWCRDARTAERLYTGPVWAGQGCYPGMRVGVVLFGARPA